MRSGVTAAVAAELSRAENQPIHLYEVTFEDGTVYVTDAPIAITWNGNTYTALGQALGFDGVEDSADLKIVQARIRFGIAEQSMIAALLNQEYVGRRIVIRKALLKEGQPDLDIDFTLGSLSPQAGSAALAFTRTNPTSLKVNSSGLLELVAADTPRFDYHPVTLEPRGLLIEGSHQNLALRSAEFDSASWGKVNSSVTANVGTSPDGTSNADKLVENTANSSHYLQQVFTKAASSLRYSLTVFAKAGERTWLQLWGTSDAGGVNSAKASFDLSNGAVGTTATGGTGFTVDAATITQYKGGWYRCEIIFTTDALTELRALIMLATGSSVASVFYVGDGASGAPLYGADLKQSALLISTSHIPTTSAAVTRSADICKDTAFGVNATEGTLVVEFEQPVVNANASRIGAQIDDGSEVTGNERVSAPQIGGAGTTVLLNVVDGGVSQATPNAANTIVANQVHRFAGAYKENDFACCMDGGTVATDTSGTLPTLSTLRIGSSNGGGSPFSGWIRRVRYYKQRLPDAALVILSAGGEVGYGVPTIVPDPIQIFDGLMDSVSIQETPGQDSAGAMQITASSHWGGAQRHPGRHTNHEEQQVHFPGDMGFEFVSEQARDIMWGRGIITTAPPPENPDPEPEHRPRYREYDAGGD